jgi:aspartyl-tRNA(Asn)/glutamyl-tRNA(Gln) amidotransferase subunit B
MNIEAIIGLEIHLQLNSPTKMFCDCPNVPAGPPNLNTCPTCLWLPGAIPRFSRNVLEKAVLLCLSLHCEIQHESAFDQKVYYYPDLPKGFQLSQFHKPLSKNGWLNIVSEADKPKRLRIRKIHMEEDVARLVHEAEDHKQISLVDFNRAGAPLVEIVTEPDMRSSYDAMEFLKVLRRQVRYSGSSDCSMEQGTMRVDANVSIRRAGSLEYNTKVEVKNMNSIRNVGDAIEYEIRRQKNSIEKGGEIILHTRLWDEVKKITSPMRGKFEGPCIPDPTVSRIVITQDWLNEMKARLPEMPDKKISRFIKEYGLSGEEAALVSSEPELSLYFEDTVKKGAPPRTAVHWLTAQMTACIKEKGLSIGNVPVSAENFANLLCMLERNEITSKTAKKMLSKMFETDKTPEQIVKELDLKQVSDRNELKTLVEKLLAHNHDAVESVKNGKSKAMDFLVGQAMRESGGKANPRIIQEIIAQKLKEQRSSFKN